MASTVQDEKCAKERVVDAARHLFSCRGFHQTAMADLAEEATVSVGAIYRCFKGKAEIIEAIVLHDKEARLHALTDLPSRVKEGEISAEDAFVELLRGQLCDKDEPLVQEILAEAYRNEVIARVIAPWGAAYREVVRALAHLVNPDLAGEALDGAEEMLLATIFGLSYRTFSGPRLDAEHSATLIARFMVRALSASPPPPAG